MSFKRKTNKAADLWLVLCDETIPNQELERSTVMTITEGVGDQLRELTFRALERTVFSGVVIWAGTKLFFNPSETFVWLDKAMGLLLFLAGFGLVTVSMSAVVRDLRSLKLPRSLHALSVTILYLMVIGLFIVVYRTTGN